MQLQERGYNFYESLLGIETAVRVIVSVSTFSYNFYESLLGIETVLCFFALQL